MRNEKLHDLLGSDQDFEPSKNKNSDSELLSDTEVVDQKRNLEVICSLKSENCNFMRRIKQTNKCQLQKKQSKIRGKVKI